jgi:hypothetical protein
VKAKKNTIDRLRCGILKHPGYNYPMIVSGKSTEHAILHPEIFRVREKITYITILLKR